MLVGYSIWKKTSKFRKVGTAKALTGRVFPNPPPPEYAWVQVVSVSDESCEIDIPTEDGIELLGDARNQYILWHRRDIILSDGEIRTAHGGVNPCGLVVRQGDRELRTRWLC
jgi:hypothetical protein